jgi:predicted  nucleic acid-binding Zn-ribbon protein
VCEGNIGVAFARVHGAAERVHDLEAELNSIDSDIDRLARRLRQGGLSEGEAAALVREIRSLQRDSDSVRRQIRLADNRLRAIQREEQLRLASAGA